MEFEIVSAGDGDDTELLALRAWLRDDRDLRGLRVGVVEGQQPGTMGGVVDALHVAISDAADLTTLAVSIATWLSTRGRRRSRVVRAGDGGTGESAGRELSGTADAAEVLAVLQGGQGDQVGRDGQGGEVRS